MPAIIDSVFKGVFRSYGAVSCQGKSTRSDYDRGTACFWHQYKPTSRYGGSTGDFPHGSNKRQGCARQPSSIKEQTIPMVNAAACHILIAVLREAKGDIVIDCADSSSSPVQKVSLKLT